MMCLASRSHAPHAMAYWYRPVRTDVCSMSARMPRYPPTTSGTRSAAPIRETGQNGSSRHVLSLFDSSSRGRNEQSSALNPRVRGSSPWRRTRHLFTWSFITSRSFLCPVCTHSAFGSLARSVLARRSDGGQRRLVKKERFSLDQANWSPLPAQLPSATSAGTVMLRCPRTHSGRSRPGNRRRSQAVEQARAFGLLVPSSQAQRRLAEIALAPVTFPPPPRAPQGRPMRRRYRR